MTPVTALQKDKGGLSKRRVIGLIAGPAAFLAIHLIGVPAGLEAMYADPAADDLPGSPLQAWTVFSLLVLMAIWWVSEAIPIAVTALLPMVVLPVGQVAPLADVAGAYLHPIVVLLLGGFIIAKAIERWGLHERIALGTLSHFGGRRKALLAGFMATAALLSMWISNTATAIMLVPIALSIAVTLADDDEENAGRFTILLLLGIAWACSIGGLGTYIGTPTNLLVKDAVERSTGEEIGFVTWMALGVPAVLVLVPLAWWLLSRFEGAKSDVSQDTADKVAGMIDRKVAALGPMSVAEKRVIGMFAFIASLWIFGIPLRELEIGGVQPLSGLSDSVAAIIGVVLCFLIPAGDRSDRAARLLDWKTAESIPWGVVLLFGGGMALAGAMRYSGMSAWLGGELAIIGTLPVILLIALVTLLIIFLTEITSNVATAAATMPVLIAVGEASDIDVALLAAPVALAASCAFMLPMATGPNAVIYASGKISLEQMARAGFRLNLLASVAIIALSYFLAPLVF
ncbi:SLC13 family permease [Aurantiacibacter gangjinensis]|nr:DASS family sodium-coupled anion symporter [Aurantiacibacter gangjinensis]